MKLKNIQTFKIRNIQNPKHSKSETIENIRKNNVNIKSCLYSSIIKLLKLE